jgi:hypothetical protein
MGVWGLLGLIYGFGVLWSEVEALDGEETTVMEVVFIEGGRVGAGGH